MDSQLIAAICSGGIVVAVIEGVREALAWHRSRKAIEEDRESENIDSRVKTLEMKVDALVESQKYLLYEQIRHLAQKYISNGEVNFDDRRMLNNMHQAYHDGLHGNGDLDILMDEVNKLPLM